MLVYGRGLSRHAHSDGDLDPDCHVDSGPDGHIDCRADLHLIADAHVYFYSHRDGDRYADGHERTD